MAKKSKYKTPKSESARKPIQISGHLGRAASLMSDGMNMFASGGMNH